MRAVASVNSPVHSMTYSTPKSFHGRAAGPSGGRRDRLFPLCLPLEVPSLAGGRRMTITISHLQPVIAIVAGVLILVAPRLLNYIVAIYLIVVGVIGLGLFRGLS